MGQPLPNPSCGRKLPAQKAQRSKKFNLARNFQSRSKFSISLEKFNLESRRLDFPTTKKIGPRWVARSKISFSLGNFQSRSKSRIVLIFGPSGWGGGRTGRKMKKRIRRNKKVVAASLGKVLRAVSLVPDLRQELQVRCLLCGLQDTSKRRSAPNRKGS